MINFKFVRFTLVIYVSHKVNVLVTDMILNITSQEHLIFTSLHIGSRLFTLLNRLYGGFLFMNTCTAVYEDHRK